MKKRSSRSASRDAAPVAVRTPLNRRREPPPPPPPSVPTVTPMRSAIRTRKDRRVVPPTPPSYVSPPHGEEQEKEKAAEEEEAHSQHSSEEGSSGAPDALDAGDAQRLAEARLRDENDAVERERAAKRAAAARQAHRQAEWAQQKKAKVERQRLEVAQLPDEVLNAVKSIEAAVGAQPVESEKERAQREARRQEQKKRKLEKLKLDELRAVAGVTLAKRESKGDSLVTVNLTPELRQYQANKASVPRGRVKRLGQFASRRSRVK